MKNGPYELIVAPENYPGKKYRDKYAYEHIIVWWKNNNEIPAKGFEIHHINGDHRDNRIENLQLLTNHEHQKLHGRFRTANAKLDVICNNCLITFQRRGNSVRSSLKNYGKIYCGRSCQVTAQQKDKKKKIK